MTPRDDDLVATPGGITEESADALLSDPWMDGAPELEGVAALLRCLVGDPADEEISDRRGVAALLGGVDANSKSTERAGADPTEVLQRDVRRRRSHGSSSQRLAIAAVVTAATLGGAAAAATGRLPLPGTGGVTTTDVPVTSEPLPIFGGLGRVQRAGHDIRSILRVPMVPATLTLSVPAADGPAPSTAATPGHEGPQGNAPLGGPVPTTSDPPASEAVAARGRRNGNANANASGNGNANAGANGNASASGNGSGNGDGGANRNANANG